jgi:heme A synthase
MKRPIFMLISSIYGLLLGAILVISPSEAMKTYGYNSLDFLHNDLSIHLGLLVIIIAIYLFLKRNSENQELVNTILWMNCIASITGALYDIYALKHIDQMPTLGYFDIGLRLVIGITTAFYLKK